MAEVFHLTGSPWRAIVKAFKDDLAQRVQRDLAQGTTLAALDLRPKCLREKGTAAAGGNANTDFVDGSAEAAPKLEPSSCAQQGTASSPQRRSDAAAPATAEANAAVLSIDSALVPSARHCSQCADRKSGGVGAVPSAAAATAAALVFTGRTLSRLHQAAAADPSPDGVLSPVSPPSSRRTSVSDSATSSAAQGTSPYSDVATSSTCTVLCDPNVAAPVGAAPAGSVCRDNVCGSSCDPPVRNQPARPQGTSLQPEASEVVAEHASAAESEQTTDTVAAAAAAAACSQGPAPQPLLQRRPATMRLRCIVRDPAASSMLAAARGHVDDPDLPLCRPRGRTATAAAAVVGSGGGGESRYEQPGHLLLLEVAVLGRGAFGFVTLVTDAVTERYYALKRLRRSSVSPKHVMQEQQALRLLMRDYTPSPGPDSEPSTQLQLEGPRVCSRCGGMTGSRGPSADGAPPATAGSRPPSSSGACGGQRAGGGRCAAGLAATSGIGQAPRPCQCRFCRSGAAAAAVGAAAGCRNQCGGGGAVAGPTMGAARAAWLVKQQALGLVRHPQQQQQHQVAQQASAPQPVQAREQQQQQVEVHWCSCRRRRGQSFCLRQLGTFQDDQYLYLLLDYCPGGDLDRLLRSVTRKTLVPRSSWLVQVLAGPAVTWRGLPEAAVRFYAAGILMALEELHSLFIVYRDLKPGNVLIDGHGYPRLADFGMVKVLGGPAGRATSACGTLDYMAPEIVKLECEQMAKEGRAQGLENWVDSNVVRKAAAAAAPEAAAGRGGGGGRRDVAARGRRRREDCGQGSYGLGVDWWSYGAVLYVLLTGCKPFCPPEAEEAGEDPTKVLVRIINPWYEVPLPVYLSPAARDLLRRLLVRQPKWRLGCGGGGAQEVREHPFFAGFDWEAFEERRLPPPYPSQAVSLSQDQEAESVADFFGFYGSSYPEPPPLPANHRKAAAAPAQQQQPVNWLQDF